MNQKTAMLNYNFNILSTPGVRFPRLDITRLMAISFAASELDSSRWRPYASVF